jgi:hypothetical protein
MRMEAPRIIRARSALLRLAPLACAAALVSAAPASAAFAPQLSINFSPATPGAKAAITATQTQQPGETPARTVVVSFPVGFAPNPGAKATICTPDPDGPLRCPPTSQIGTASATADAFGYQPSYQGWVYFGGPIAGKIGAFQLNILLISEQFGEQNIFATAQLRPDGGYDNVFDNLPNALVTSFTLSLQGGDLALLQTPQKCGTYNINANFTSQKDETATGSIPVNIACKSTTPTAKPKVSAPGLSKTGAASFTLSKASKVTVTVTRGGQRVKRRTVQGKKGANKVKMGTLRAGRYTVTIAATGGNTVRRTVTIA